METPALLNEDSVPSTFPVNSIAALVSMELNGSVSFQIKQLFLAVIMVLSSSLVELYFPAKSVKVRRCGESRIQDHCIIF